MTRYFLTEEREVTIEEYVRAERDAGFRPKGEDKGQPATAGFSSGKISGRTEESSPTGRMSCMCPALQNIPIRTPQGTLLRKLLKKDGHWAFGRYDG